MHARFMATVVKAKPDESTDSVIRRFKKKVLGDEVLIELKKREFYRKPSLEKKEKMAELRRRRKHKRKSS